MDQSLPTVPSYEQVQAEMKDENEEISWLYGSYSTRRGIRAVYNPHTAGGISSLNDRLTGSADIGSYEINLTSPIVSLPLVP